MDTANGSNPSSETTGPDPQWLATRLEELTGRRPRRPVEVFADTTEIMNIHRGHVVALESSLYAIMGHCYETRFGISDQPKYWVLRATDLKTGEHKIIKTVFNEEFIVRIGELRIRCYRSPEKESEVLELTRGDLRFMQGETVSDSASNQIRLLDFIPGPTLFDQIHFRFGARRELGHHPAPRRHADGPREPRGRGSFPRGASFRERHRWLQPARRRTRRGFQGIGRVRREGCDTWLTTRLRPKRNSRCSWWTTSKSSWIAPASS